MTFMVWLLLDRVKDVALTMFVLIKAMRMIQPPAPKLMAQTTVPAAVMAPRKPRVSEYRSCYQTWASPPKVCTT